MIPILFKTMTEGTVRTDNGIGPLANCLSCSITEERNGSYELELTYPMSGVLADQIEPNRFIKAKPNFTDSPQIFRIYKVGKSINGIFHVYAQHISYDLSGKLITSGNASTCSGACTLLQAQAGNFTITTDKNVSATFKIMEPSSVRSWFGGKAGSLLDVFGTGEWYFDNYTCTLKQARGSDRGAVIRYGKNLTELSQEINIENLCTGVVPFYIDADGAVTTGTKVNTGLTLDVPKDVAIDFSADVDPESGTAITTQLANLATKYISNNILTVANNSITLDFVQLSELKERVDLCDSVKVIFEALGISATFKCIATTWDVLEERYTSTTFGSAKTNIADTFSAIQREMQKTASRSFMADSIKHATELITGNLGGYVILHDTDSDGEPDEILIMNTNDISTATKVWRWNSGGLGYSSAGYAGPYGLAMTADGEIVADFITTGVLNADLIKAGVIQDADGNSSINMTDGVAILNNLKAKNSFTLVDSNGTRRGRMGYNSVDGSTFRLYDDNGDWKVAADVLPSGAGNLALSDANDVQVATLSTSNQYGGSLNLRDTNGTYLMSLEPDANGGHFVMKNVSDFKTAEITNDANGGHFILNGATGVEQVSNWVGNYGGVVQVNNTSGATRAQLYVNSDDSGVLFLTDGTRTINLDASSGMVNSSTFEASLMFRAKYNNVTQWYASSGSNGGVSRISNVNGYTKVSLGVADDRGYVALVDAGGNQTIDMNIASSGNIRCVSLTQTSSRKVKENIKPIEDAEKILELQAVSFDFKNKELGADKRGFIAEDVEKVLPNLVVGDENNKALNYIEMIPYLQEVIKKQEARIKALEDKLNGTN